MKRVLGTSLSITLNGCANNIITSKDELFSILHEVTTKIGGTVVNKFSHDFEPHGMTLFLVLAESHLIAHTWPEYGILVVDLFVCIPNPEFDNALDFLQNKVKANSFVTSTYSHEVEF